VPANAAHPFDFDSVGGGWLTGGTRGVMLWPLRSDPGRAASLRVGPPQTILSGPGNALWCDSRASTNGRVLAITDVTAAILIRRDVASAPTTLGPQPGMRRSAISPDGKWVATCSGPPEDPSKLVRIWDGQSGRHIAVLPLAGGPWQAEFSPDNQWLTTYNLKEAAHVWKVGSWTKPLWSFAAGRIIFSPDARLMVLNDVIGSLRLLKISSGEEVARVSGPERTTYWPQCFTPDGTKLFAMGEGLCAWDLRLIRDQLQAMGLDWDHKDWPPFPPAVPDPRGRRLRFTVDIGMGVQEGPGAATPPSQQPTLEQRDAK